jgi:hypothetical protein
MNIIIELGDASYQAVKVATLGKTKIKKFDG